MPKWPNDTELRGEVVVLEPLGSKHAQELEDCHAQGGLDNLWYTTVPDRGGMAQEIQNRLEKAKTGTCYPMRSCASQLARPLG